ncbi:MAG: TRAP transporter substrate-binding protein [Oscillospiraceae bacterium]|nr:TRAP transporter substrate-binding protein [Oscillospiraceae bacterium]
MKKSMKLLALLLAVVMLFSLMTACGSSSSSTTTDTSSSSSSGDSAASSSSDASASTSSDDGTVYELSFSTHDPATSAKTIYFQEWADAINEASGGRINITVYSGGSLAASTAALDALRTGVCDIAWIYTSYFSGQFPLSEVICNPIGVTSVPQAVDVMYDLYDEYPELQDELSEFELLMIHSNPTNKISTVNKPVTSVSDLSGMTFRASAGTASDLLIAWGATPIQMAVGDIYSAVQKATIDGYIFDWTGIQSFGLQEVTNYYTTMPVYLGPYFVMMNKDSFNELPEDLQQLIRDYSGYDASMGMAWVYEADERDGKQTIEEAGGTFVDVTDEDEFREAAQSLLTTYAENNSTDTFDASAYIARAEELAEQYYISSDDINATLDEMGY